MSDNARRATRVGHCKKDEDAIDVYVGRGRDGSHILSGLEIGERGWLGNPFTLEEHSRAESVAKFRVGFEHAVEINEELRSAVGELAGKTLGCWCQRLEEDGPACHAEVIAEVADRIAAESEA